MPLSLSDKTRNVVVDVIARDEFIARIIFLNIISERQMRRIRYNIKLYESVVSSSQRRDRSRSINEEIEERLLKYIDYRSTIFVDEMCYFIYDEFDILVNISTICRFLRRID